MYYATVNFNPRGHISLDKSFRKYRYRIFYFNPRGHISLDLKGLRTSMLKNLFQSTRPHKPRPTAEGITGLRRKFQSTRPHKPRPAKGYAESTGISFQSTRPHKPRLSRKVLTRLQSYFNPRGHISLDGSGLMPDNLEILFQSTRPHKPRRTEKEF